VRFPILRDRTNNVFASDGTFSFTDLAANMPARFYRVSMP